MPKLMWQTLAFKISVKSAQHCSKNVQLVFGHRAKQGQSEPVSASHSPTP